MKSQIRTSAIRIASANSKFCISINRPNILFSLVSLITTQSNVNFFLIDVVHSLSLLIQKHFNFKCFHFIFLVLAFDRSGWTKKFLQFVSYAVQNLSSASPRIFVKSQFVHYERENWDIQHVCVRVYVCVCDSLCMYTVQCYALLCACFFDGTAAVCMCRVWKSTPYCIIAWYDLWYMYIVQSKRS